MHLEPEQVAEIQEILGFYAKGLPVYAFGSRVHGRTLKKTYDLDLCVRADGRVDEKRMRKLRDAFDISDLATAGDSQSPGKLVVREDSVTPSCLPERAHAQCGVWVACLSFTTAEPCLRPLALS